MRGTLVVGAALAVLAGGCGSREPAATTSSRQAAGPDPKALVLGLHDLPAGFVRVSDSGTVDNARAAAGGPPGQVGRLVGWGRLTGYQAHLARYRPGGPDQGPLDIHSVASVYRDAKGAAAALAYTSRHLVPRGLSPIALAVRMGARAHEYVGQIPFRGVPGLLYVLIWREGRVFAGITVTGAVGDVSAADVAAVAERQEARIVAQLQPTA